MSNKAILLVAAVLCTTVRAGEPCGTDCKPSRPFLSLFKKKDCGKEDCQKECIRVEDKKKITHVHYGCIEKDVCKSNCTKCKFGGKKCGSCPEQECDKCGKVRTVRQLVKRFEVEEVCATKCVPVPKEVCPTTHCPTIVPAPTGEAPAVIGEILPGKPVPGAEKVPVKPVPVEPMKK